MPGSAPMSVSRSWRVGPQEFSSRSSRPFLPTGPLVSYASFTFACWTPGDQVPRLSTCFSRHRPRLPGSRVLPIARKLAGDRQAEQTAGILLTNTFGVANAAIAAWEDLAAKHGIPLVIDSAAGFGSRSRVRGIPGVPVAPVKSSHSTPPRRWP